MRSYSNTSQRQEIPLISGWPFIIKHMALSPEINKQRIFHGLAVLQIGREISYLQETSLYPAQWPFSANIFSHLSMQNYRMRFSMTSWIDNSEVWVISQSQSLRHITQIRVLIIHDITWKPNSIIVLLYISYNLQKNTLHFQNTTQIKGLETSQALNSTC